jgi:hypothetical protein
LHEAVQKRIFFELLEETTYPKLFAQHAGQGHLADAYHASITV